MLEAVYPDGWVRRWTLRRRGRWRARSHVVIPTRGQAAAVSLGADGSVAAFANDADTVTVVRGVERSRVRRFSFGATPSTDTVAVAADGRTLATGTSDGLVELWGIGDRPLARTLPGGGAASLAFLDRDAVFAVGRRGRVELWKMGKVPRLTGTLVPPGHDDAAPVSMVAASEGNTLVSLHSPPAFAAAGQAYVPWEGRVIVWELRRRKPARMIDVPVNLGGSLGAEFAVSSDAGTLAFADEDRVAIWGLGRSRRRATLPVPVDTSLGSVSAIALSRHGEDLAAVTGERDRVEVWDVRRRRRIGRLRIPVEAIPVVAWSPDGATLAVSAGGQIRFWDARRRRAAGSPIVDVGTAQQPIHFSPDGRTLISVGGGRLRLYDVETHRILGEPLPLPPNHDVAAFGLTGGSLATAGESSSVLLWDPLLLGGNEATFTRRVCAIVLRNLSRTQWRQSLPGEPYRKTCPTRPG